MIEIIFLTLSWTNPVLNADGSALEDLAGVYVYNISDERVYTWVGSSVGDRVTIDFSYTGCVYLTAFDASGNESDPASICWPDIEPEDLDLPSIFIGDNNE